LRVPRFAEKVHFSCCALVRLPQRVSSFLFTLTLVALCHAAVALSLPEQLALAEKDEDTHAQIELIRRILSEKPDDDELRARLADLWLSVEDYDMAESTVREWTAAPESVRVPVLAAVLFVRDRKKDEAIVSLEGYLTENPDDLEITRQLAGYLNGMGEDQKVVDLLSRAPGVEEDAGLLVSRALARRKLRDFAGALKDFAAADGQDREAESVVGNRPSFERLRAAVAGIDEAGAILAGKPDDLRARLLRAYWYLSTGAASIPALEDAEAARRIDAKSVAALLLFAGASNQTGRLSARDALEKFEVDVTKPLPALEVVDRLQRYDGQLAKNPKDVSGLLARGRELSDNAQQYGLAMRDAEAALAIDPGSAKARAAKIAALVKLGRIEDAAAELRVWDAAKPPPEVLAAPLNDLAAAAAAASQLDAALEYANRAIKAKPEAHYYKQRAAILQRLERFADAQSDLSRARQLEKKDAP
jgi:tetratricopeptide (TPR) repeat protein